MMNKFVAAVFACSMGLLLATGVTGEESQRLHRQNNAIFYNGDLEGDLQPDADVVRGMLNAESGIDRIVLTGSFTLTTDALDVARVIDDFGLTTEIRDQCTDACLYMFVAGKERILAKGAKIGLRRRTIDASTVKEKFDTRKARYGWEDEFGQAVMLYDIGQSDMRWALLYLMDHGVTLEFGLKVFATPREDMWWPTRQELVEGGVIGK